MKKVYLFVLSLSISFSALAREGMWLPQLLAQLNYSEMQRMGLQISAEDIYSVNQSSLKDAIVHFNGGCTGELISSKGLLLTNHHCGFSMIQSHSTLEKNYLKDGFWAMNESEELANPGVFASIVKSLEDVTNQVLEGVDQNLSAEEREKAMAANIKTILAAEKEKNPKLDFEIKDFFYGNQYILISKAIYRDVRLVGAPPSSIGKYGADTDNWVWPRHTGDFSIFRVYADANNEAAEYDVNNVPYTPAQHLKVNIAGTDDGDFTMVYGYPGSTQQYLPASEVNNIISEYNPFRISIRDEILAILDAKMRVDEATRLKYASKYARISNSWKRWKGEIIGVEATNGIIEKRKEEVRFTKASRKIPAIAEYEHLVPEMVIAYERRVPLYLERYAYIEVGYYGLESFRHLLAYSNLVGLTEKGASAEDLQKEGERLALRLEGFMKDYDAALEAEVAQKILPLYLDAIKTDLPEIIEELKSKEAKARAKYISKLFAKSPLVDATFKDLLTSDPEKAAKIVLNSEAYQLSMAMYKHFIAVLNPAVADQDAEIEKLQATYVKALQIAFPEQAMYPDANSTLRVSYGTVEPYEARDGVEYESRTYLEGVLEKYVPGDYEFDLPSRLIELHNSKDYGPYGENGKMPVCFVATNHTTGGNSGSPVLNAYGELIGLNFDRAWEGVMSDMYFDTRRCRNIMVDLRYVLFIVDKFAGAGYLVDEMDLETESVAKRVAKTEALKAEQEKQLAE
ncbi:MAG: serine protease [Bacteroidetes bacterium]|nr:MAG: serine protease [Bacteroidota bacterium]